MPRTDLKVKVQGVDVKAGFALGSYATFKKMGNGTMMMGDLVLLDEEIAGVMAGPLEKGIAITAGHNHLNEMSPHVVYMHYSAGGGPGRAGMAPGGGLCPGASPRGARGRGGGAAPAAAASGGPEIEQKQVETALGRSGRMNNGVLQFSVARAEAPHRR